MNTNVTKELCDLPHGVASESCGMKGGIPVTEKLTPGVLKCHLQLSTSAGDQLYFRDSVCPVLDNCFAVASSQQCKPGLRAVFCM